MTPLETVLDFVERWNKLDEEPEVAQAALEIQARVDGLLAERFALVERVAKLEVVAETAKSFGQECGACGREGFGTEALIVATGADEGVRPCPECSPLVLALAAIDGVKA